MDSLVDLPVDQVVVDHQDFGVVGGHPQQYSVAVGKVRRGDLQLDDQAVVHHVLDSALVVRRAGDP